MIPNVCAFFSLFFYFSFFFLWDHGLGVIWMFVLFIYMYVYFVSISRTLQ